ncbi:NUDIX hydrolase [candidate division WOR-3 bacterium]|nr:NUDIX hydrolase [candidate division WOR-3 bacterium]
MTNIKYCPRCKHLLKTLKMDGRKRLVCPKCNWINYENPLPSVVALVKNSKNEILLIKRGVSPHKGRWALPSGFIEINETPEKACLRELKEETGLKGKILRLIGVYSQKTKIYKNVLLIAYEVKIEKGKLLPGTDTVEVKFIGVEKLPFIPFSSNREIIKDIIKNQKSDVRSQKSEFLSSVLCLQFSVFL